MDSRAVFVLVIGFVCFATCVGATDTAILATVGGPRTIQASHLWTFHLDEDAAIRFGDNAKFKYHGSLAQAVPFGESGVVLYDNIERKLMLLDRMGRRSWAVGQIGDGPEDHRQPCEVRVTPTGHIALLSIWPPTKVIYYDDQGEFIRSWPLPGLRDSQRFVYTSGPAFALTTESDYITNADGVTVMHYAITAFGDAELPRASRQIKTAEIVMYRPGMVVHEEDLWITPRVEAGPGGTLLVQPDVYAPIVDVYDRNIDRVARIEGDWRPPAQSDEYKRDMLERTNGAKVAADTQRALRHLFCYADKEIWLQKPDDERLVFAAFSATAQMLGDVEVTGIEDFEGDLVLHDHFMLVFHENEDGSGILRQTFRLYRLSY